MSKTKTDLLSPWVRRFLLEYLMMEKNHSRNTQMSYRDTLQQFLPFIARSAKRRLDQLQVEDITPARTRAFLQDVEATRGCGITTRNQRLAAIQSLACFIGLFSPEYIQWRGQIQTVVAKKAASKPHSYLEKDELDALLNAPDRRTAQGRRDYAILLFMYNTGARASEVAHVQIADLNLGSRPGQDLSSVLIHGKGKKIRHCPVWDNTAAELAHLIGNRTASERVFLNVRGQPLTRYGIRTLVKRYAAKAAKKLPSLAKKRVSPHTIRHTTATHLNRAGVDINTIRGWMGHVSIITTNIYAQMDLEMKAKALASCEIQDGKAPKRKKPWRHDKGLMKFLKTL